MFATPNIPNAYACKLKLKINEVLGNPLSLIPMTTFSLIDAGIKLGNQRYHSQMVYSYQRIERKKKKETILNYSLVLTRSSTASQFDV